MYKSILSSESSDDLITTISLVLVAWELADGANGIEVGDVLLVAWLHHPNLVASWFDNKPHSQERWINSQDYLFNGISETSSYAKAEKLRNDLLLSLASVNSESSQTIKEYTEALKNLEVPNWEDN